MSDEYKNVLAGAVAVGRLDCTLLEYARGIKYFVDQESRKFNPDTHLINLLRRAACVGWENIELFHAERLERYEVALREIAAGGDYACTRTARAALQEESADGEK